MFASCVYCTSALGANEVIEAFPVGRKLAFDGATGRLWVVCPRCARWNLSPLEERWEAIETCERLYRASPLRASTDHIGLAKVREGTQLVRIGAPSRPEFAAWRYAREFARRRQTTWMVGGTMIAALAGWYAIKFTNPGLSAGLPLLGVLPQAMQGWTFYQQWLKPVAQVSHNGKIVVVRRSAVAHMRLEFDDAEASEWRLNVFHKNGRSVLSGPEAQRVLGRVLTMVNQEGGSARKVDSAVQALADAGSADAFVRSYIGRNRGFGTSNWTRAYGAQVLALEMALHENTERAALDGELAALEASWREAAEIAKIADGLLLPSQVDERLQRLRDPSDH